jgi:hypothetical protein
VAVSLTAFVLSLAVRNILLYSHRRGSLFPWDYWFRGWPLVAVNAAFYGYLCWLAFWFIRMTHGRERVFIIGWFSAILLPPLEILQHGLTLEIKYLCAFGLAVSLLTAISILLHPTGIDACDARTATTPRLTPRGP